MSEDAGGESASNAVVGMAHEIWAAAQLVPGEGIEDGVERIASMLACFAIRVHHAECDAQAADEERAELLERLRGPRAKQWESVVSHAVAQLEELDDETAQAQAAALRALLADMPEPLYAQAA